MPELEAVILSNEPWSDEHAKKVVKRDFQTAEMYRSVAHDPRWSAADRLYRAFVAKRKWEGTNIPRSSLPVYLVFQQVEALIPQILGEVFSAEQWFETAPRPGTLPEEARATEQVIRSQADASQIREQIRKVCKSGLIYGNGICELSYKKSQRKSHRWIRVPQAIYGIVPDPITGIPTQAQTGVKMVPKKTEVVYEESSPKVEWISLKDFFVDPNAPSPNIRDARFVVKRAYLTIDEILEYKGQDGFKIPERDVLLRMSTDKRFSQSDQSKMWAEATYAGSTFNPAEDTTADPAGRRIEVLSYWTKNRMVWMLNRDMVIFNEANQYGFIPFYNWFYTDMLDRFYALGVADVLQGEQALQGGVVNARLDELALSIHTPAVVKRGSTQSPSSYRRRPDQVTTVDDINDVRYEQPQNITQQAFSECAMSDVRAQKVTGVSDLAVLGSPSSGGNSANRTATGVAAQQGAAKSRITYLVENLENILLTPMLEDWQSLNIMHLSTEQAIELAGPDGRFIQIDPLYVKNANVKFSMRGSSRMRARMGMLQIWPQILQTFLNPAFISSLNQNGKTINFEEVARIILDAVDYQTPHSLIRDMSDEEKQAQQQLPADQQLKQQMQQERIEGQGHHLDTKIQGDMLKEIIKGAVKHGTTEPKTPGQAR